MITLPKKFNGTLMAFSPPLYGTTSDLLTYTWKAGLINATHSRKKQATDKWRMEGDFRHTQMSCTKTPKAIIFELMLIYPL